MKYKIISYLPRSNRTLLQMAKIPTCSSTPNCREGSIFILFTNDISHSFKLSCLCENISFYGRCFCQGKDMFFPCFLLCFGGKKSYSALPNANSVQICRFVDRNGFPGFSTAWPAFMRLWSVFIAIPALSIYPVESTFKSCSSAPRYKIDRLSDLVILYKVLHSMRARYDTSISDKVKRSFLFVRFSNYHPDAVHESWEISYPRRRNWAPFFCLCCGRWLWLLYDFQEINFQNKTNR